jgi:hypothetical protein
MPYFLVGHVGDGNFHLGYLIDPDNARGARNRAEQLNHQLVARALALGGTCTGEHGVGLHKMDFLVSEAGVGAVDDDAHHQARAGPGQHHEPGEDVLSLDSGMVFTKVSDRSKARRACIAGPFFAAARLIACAS